MLFSSHVLSEGQSASATGWPVVRAGRLVANEDVATLLARRKRRVELQFAGDPPDLSSVRHLGDRGRRRG